MNEIHWQQDFHQRAFGIGVALPQLMKRITSLSIATVALTLTAQAQDFLKISGNIRTRYEFRETDPADPSHALTVRARLGLTIGEFNGFSAFIEGEGTQGIVEDFQTPGGARPKAPGGTAIADPNNAEINQGYLQYKKDGILAKVGRQRIIRNGANFIGNVGWRQNEQTFDAAQVGYSGNGFNVSYAYFDRVNRIFGVDAGGALTAFEGDFHIFDFDFKIDAGKIGGYAYLLDVDNNANVGESNTFGAFFKGKNGLFAEFAFQDGTSALVTGPDQDYTALYGRLSYTTDAAGGKGTIGVDYLGENFKVPLSTAHAYYGFADAFLAQQIGLNRGPGGNFNGSLDWPSLPTSPETTFTTTSSRCPCRSTTSSNRFPRLLY